MKRFFPIFVISFILLITVYSRGLSQTSKLSVIVIDAGHGGKDPGAVGKNSMEKNIVLSIALKFGKMINDKFPNIKVIYTRNSDEFIELYRRAKIANENKADLFISIHCNSSKNTEPYGSETYVMGINKTKANLEVARKENSSILYEENYSRQYEGYDPYSPEATIIFSLYQNLFLDQSLDLATRIQKYFTKSFSLLDRGIKQAGFLVLYNVTMPGVLVEAGFISNSEEETLLKSMEGQQKVAQSLYKAFCEYKNYKEGLSGEIEDINSSDVIIDTMHENNIVQVPFHVQDTVKPLTIRNRAVNKDLIFTIAKIIYKVQFITSPSKFQANSPKFKGFDNVSFYMDNKMFKYTAGNFSSLSKATDYQAFIRKNGYKDAFIVVFLNGKRISLEEAKKKLKEN